MASSPELEKTSTTVAGQSSSTSQEQARLDCLKTSKKLANPLRGLTDEELAQRAKDFCAKNDINDPEDLRAFQHGAILAGDASRYNELEGLTQHERKCLDQEVNNKWMSLPKRAWFVVFGKLSSCSSRVPPMWFR